MVWAVFRFEMMQAARRGRGFFLRWLYAAFVPVQIAPVFFLSRGAWARFLTSLSPQAFFENFVVQHFVILALVTPGLVAGALTKEKMRGTLQYLLTANVRSGELILGKILAYVFQLLVLALVGLPLLCFFSALGGDFGFPLVVLVSSAAFVFGIAAVSVLCSVWCRTTRDAVLASYFVITAVVLLVPVVASTRWGPTLSACNPLRALALADASMRWLALGEFVALWGALGCASVLLASWRLRGAYRRQLQVIPAGRQRWWQARRGRPRGNPVLWREQHVEGIAPVGFLRGFPRWLGVVAVMVGSAGLLGFSLLQAAPATFKPWAALQAGEWGVLQAGLVMIAGEMYFHHGLAALIVLSLVVAIRASGTITGEKERGTWLPLMLTPLTTQKIVTGKHWGIVWAGLPYVAAHSFVAVSTGFFLSLEALTWGVLWLVGMVSALILGSALGLWASARAASSLRSLLMTLALFYLGWLLFFIPISFVLFVFRGVLELALRIIGFFADTSVPVGVLVSLDLASWSICLGLPVAFWVLTTRLLTAAVARVGRNDRTAELDFDYYFVYRDYYRKLQQQHWESPRLDDVYELEANSPGKKQEREAPIPFK